jgi:dTDP-4-amino-4,6-dideoxygalactose transaminase
MTNPFQVVRDFEQAVADYAGARFGVAVDSCSNALLLSCIYSGVGGQVVWLPRRTYPSVPCAVIHAGGEVVWRMEEYAWKGVYPLSPFSVIDGAKRFRAGMYEKGMLHCLSFHAKKILPIGRGGMILTDDSAAMRWLKLARFDGREEVPLREQSEFKVVGYNCYMTPEQAARGLQLLANLPADNPDQIEIPDYPDLSKSEIFQRVNL